MLVVRLQKPCSGSTKAFVEALTADLGLREVYVFVVFCIGFAFV